MKPWIKYGFLNALIGLLIGAYTAFTAIGNGYFVAAIAAPLAFFLTGGLLWKLIVKKKIDVVQILITGLLTGTISHYITFIILGIGVNICYWTTGQCTGSLGEPPASIISMITGAFAFSFFSLLFFGWITTPASVIIGFFLKRLENKKTLHNKELS